MCIRDRYLCAFQLCWADHTFAAFVAGARVREPVSGLLGKGDQRQHDRYFGQHADGRSKRGAGVDAPQGDGNGDRQFEEVAGSDHGRRGGDTVGNLDSLAHAIPDGKNEIGLQDQGNGNQQDVDPISGDGLSLEGENDEQCRHQGDDGDRVPLRKEHGVVPHLAATPDEQASCQGSTDEWNDDEQADGQEQCGVGDLDIADAKQQRDDRNEQDQDDQVVDGNLDKCVRGVATGEIAPHEDHGGARRCAQQHGACYVLLDLVGRKDVAIGSLEKPDGQQEHRERLDGPVDDQRDQQTLGALADAHNAAEVDLQHHGINHEPDEDGYRQRDAVDSHFVENAYHSWQETTQNDAGDHGHHHPQTHVLLKETQTSFSFHFDLPWYRMLSGAEGATVY